MDASLDHDPFRLGARGSDAFPWISFFIQMRMSRIDIIYSKGHAAYTGFVRTRLAVGAGRVSWSP